MPDIIDPRHEAQVEFLFRRACSVLKMPEFELRPLRRRVRGKRGSLRSYNQGYTTIGEKKITVDLYTPQTMKPRKMGAILRVVCHELAHHQEPPAYFWKGWKRVHASHHPRFWRRYKKNVAILGKDELLLPFLRLE